AEPSQLPETIRFPSELKEIEDIWLVYPGNVVGGAPLLVDQIRNAHSPSGATFSSDPAAIHFPSGLSASDVIELPSPDTFTILCNVGTFQTFTSEPLVEAKS